MTFAFYILSGCIAGAAYCYTRRNFRGLCLYIGHTRGKTAESIEKLFGRADSCGLYCEIYEI